MTDAPPHSLLLTRHDSGCNMARYYALSVEADLFGGSTLVRRWGRIGSSGQERRQWFALRSAAEAEGRIWAERKIRRGYMA